jgi:hypothetical protein
MDDLEAGVALYLVVGTMVKQYLHGFLSMVN